MVRLQADDLISQSGGSPLWVRRHCLALDGRLQQDAQHGQFHLHMLRRRPKDTGMREDGRERGPFISGRACEHQVRVPTGSVAVGSGLVTVPLSITFVIQACINASPRNHHHHQRTPAALSVYRYTIEYASGPLLRELVPELISGAGGIRRIVFPSA